MFRIAAPVVLLALATACAAPAPQTAKRQTAFPGVVFEDQVAIVLNASLATFCDIPPQQVYFSPEREALPKNARDTLKAVADCLGKGGLLEGEPIVLAGNITSDPSDAEAPGVARSRAEKLALYLVSQGVKPDQLQSVGMIGRQDSVELVPRTQRLLTRR